LTSSQQLPQVQRQTRFLWETPEATTVRAAIRTKRCVRQQQLRLTHRYRGCRTAHSSSPKFCAKPDLQHATIPVGDAGCHDGTGRDSDEAVCQTTTAATEPPIRGCRTAPAAPTGVLCTPGLSWETPEATTAAKRCVRQQQLRLTHRNRGCRTAPAAPTGPAPDAVLVGDAGGHDGTGRDSDEAVCQTTTAATDPPQSRLSHSSSSSHRFCAKPRSAARHNPRGRRRRPRRYGPQFGRRRSGCVL
jgi:hypothetical protein